MICAVFSSTSYLVDIFRDEAFDALKIFSNDMYFIMEDAAFCLMTIYFDYRSHRNPALLKRRACLIAIPAVLSAIAFMVNHGVHFIYWLDEDTRVYTELQYYYVIYIAPIIYVVLILIISKLNKCALSVVIMLTVARAILEGMMHEVTSTSLFVAVMLVFIHINEMRYAFYDEERRGEAGKEAG